LLKELIKRSEVILVRQAEMSEKYDATRKKMNVILRKIMEELCTVRKHEDSWRKTMWVVEKVLMGVEK